MTVWFFVLFLLSDVVVWCYAYRSSTESGGWRQVDANFWVIYFNIATAVLVSLLGIAAVLLGRA